MSEYHAVKTQFKDPDALIEALEEVKCGTSDIVVERHENAVALKDFRGKQTHYLNATGDIANIIVRRQYVKGMSNDLGFVKDVDGYYVAMISEYDSSNGLNGNWQVALKKSYSEKVLIKTASKQGFKYIGATHVNGKKQFKWLDMRG